MAEHGETGRELGGLLLTVGKSHAPFFFPTQLEITGGGRREEGKKSIF